jgi:hypothetical protein
MRYWIELRGARRLVGAGELQPLRIGTAAEELAAVDRDGIVVEPPGRRAAGQLPRDLSLLVVLQHDERVLVEHHVAVGHDAHLDDARRGRGGLALRERRAVRGGERQAERRGGERKDRGTFHRGLLLVVVSAL